MPLTQISITNIPGLVEKADKTLNDILAPDVINRLGVPGNRELTIKVSLSPSVVETIQGHQENIPKLGFSVAHKLPASQGLQGLRAFVDRTSEGEPFLAIKPGDPMGSDPNQTDISDIKGAIPGQE